MRKWHHIISLAILQPLKIQNQDCQKQLESVSSFCASYSYTTTPEVPFVCLFPHAFSLQVHLIFFRCFLSLLVDESADVVEVPLLDGQHVGSETKLYFQGQHPPSSSYASPPLLFGFISIHFVPSRGNTLQTPDILHQLVLQLLLEDRQGASLTGHQLLGHLQLLLSLADGLLDVLHGDDHHQQQLDHQLPPGGQVLFKALLPM